MDLRPLAGRVAGGVCAGDSESNLAAAFWGNDFHCGRWEAVGADAACGSRPRVPIAAWGVADQSRRVPDRSAAVSCATTRADDAYRGIDRGRGRRRPHWIRGGMALVSETTTAQ